MKASKLYEVLSDPDPTWCMVILILPVLLGAAVFLHVSGVW